MSIYEALSVTIAFGMLIAFIMSNRR
ncbi:putative holin-like toxin [Dialister sp.]